VSPGASTISDKYAIEAWDWRIIVSRDGRTMTQTTTGRNAHGQTINNSTIWEKQ
jgi:hypothetical protein